MADLTTVWEQCAFYRLAPGQSQGIPGSASASTLASMISLCRNELGTTVFRFQSLSSIRHTQPSCGLLSGTSCEKSSAATGQPREEHRGEPGQPRPPSEKAGYRWKPSTTQLSAAGSWDTLDHPDISPGPPQRQEAPVSVHSLSATSEGQKGEDRDRCGKAENRAAIDPSVHVSGLLTAVTPPHQAHQLASAGTTVLTTFQKRGLNTMVNTAATKLGSVGSTNPSSQVITKRSACKDRIAISGRPVQQHPETTRTCEAQDAKTSGKIKEAWDIQVQTESQSLHLPLIKGKMKG